MRQVKSGLAPTRENKKYDIIYGAKKRTDIGDYIGATAYERILKNEYGMTEAEIEHAIYDMSYDEISAKIWD